MKTLIVLLLYNKTNMVFYKKFKIQKVSRIEATKSKGTRNKIWDESIFWHESLIPTFG